MGVNIKQLLLILAIVVTGCSSLIGEESPSQSDKSDTQHLDVPDPADLDPKWVDYFDTNGDVLEKRIEQVKTLLGEYGSLLENVEEKQEAETKIKEFESHLQSLLLIKKQKIEKPSLVWLPKNEYSLSDYLEVSDKIRSLDSDISFKNADKQRFKYSLANVRQSLHNAYAKYLGLADNTKERFLQGLDVLALGSRLLYLEAEIDISNRLIDVDKKLLARFMTEKDHITEKLQVNIDLEQVKEERAGIKNKLAKVHEELLGLETESVKRFSLEDGQETSRLINQKLTASLIKEAILQTGCILLDAKVGLNESIHSPKDFNYQEDVEPIVTFRKNTLNRVSSWEQIINAEIDQLSQAVVKANGDVTEEEVALYQDSLMLSLTNKASLDALSRELFHITLLLGLIDYHVVESQTMIDKIQYYIQSFSQSFSDSFGAWLHYSLFDIGGVPITLMGLLKAALIIVGAILFSNIVGWQLARLAKKKGRVRESTLYAFQRIFHYLILVIGVFLALASLELKMQNIAIVLGALGIGIGFGLQNIVNNFLCGLSILFERNIKVGDFVELEGGYIGKITDVNVQNTTVHTFDGVDVIVPNSSLFAKNVINWTKKDPFQRLHIPFGVAYGTDQDKVSEVVCEASLEVSCTMRKSEGVSDPEVWLVGFGDSALNFELVVWVNIFKSRGTRAMRAMYLSVIEKALKEHEIKIPFPQRDLHLKTLPSESVKVVEGGSE